MLTAWTYVVFMDLCLLKLTGVELVVEAAAGHELVVGALLYDVASVDDEDLVGILNGT